MKKVLVTGATGFIGQHFTRSIMSLRDDVYLILLDNLSNSKLPDYLEQSKPRRYLGYIEHKNFRFYHADVRLKDSVDRIFSENTGIDICLHLASKISVADSLKYPTETFEVNTGGTKNLLDSSARYGVRSFVLASSAAVYGDSKSLPLNEELKLRPISPYGKSKAMAEKLVMSFADEVPNAISLRFFNIYGEGQKPEYAGVITKFAERLYRLMPPIIFGSGHQSRDFISIRDVVRALFIASGLQSKSESKLATSADRNVFNIGTGVPTKILDVAKIMTDLFASKFGKEGSNIRPIHRGVIPGEIQKSYADTLRANKFLPFVYHDDLRIGLQNLYGNQGTI